MKTSIIINLDGTLCDSTHREHFARDGLWSAYHEASVKDEPHQDVLELMAAMGEQNWRIYAITGRNAAYHAITTDWLFRHEAYVDDIRMRPDGDFRPDVELKPQLLLQLFPTMQVALDEVLFILEGQDKMVETWRNLGFRCWQVKSGGY